MLWVAGTRRIRLFVRPGYRHRSLESFEVDKFITFSHRSGVDLFPAAIWSECSFWIAIVVGVVEAMRTEEGVRRREQINPLPISGAKPAITLPKRML